jgi:hypothetical protein
LKPPPTNSVSNQPAVISKSSAWPNCTEITIAIHYKIKNRLFAWLDRHLHFVDTFVNAELRSIRAHFEGIATSYAERMPIMPVLEAAVA